MEEIKKEPIKDENTFLKRNNPKYIRIENYKDYEFMVLEADSKRISKVKISKTNEIFLKSNLENKSNESEK